MLRILISDVLRALFEIGLNVLDRISEQGPTNRETVNVLKKCSSKKNGIGYTIDNHELVHIYDVPHIMKNVRNNLLVSDIEYDDGKVAKFQHIIKYFKLDQSLNQMSHLTMKHLNPTGKSKMKAKFAPQVLGARVADGIEMCHTLSEGKYLTDCLPTAKLIREVDRFFDFTNGPSASGKEKVKQQRVNVSAKSLHHAEWPKMLESLRKWVFIRKSTGVKHVKHFRLDGLSAEHTVAVEGLWTENSETKKPKSRCY